MALREFPKSSLETFRNTIPTCTFIIKYLDSAVFKNIKTKNQLRTESSHSDNKSEY